MLLMLAASITWASGRGLGLESQLFGPQKALPYQLDAISQGSRESQFPGPNPLPVALVKEATRIKSITHEAV